MVNNNNLLKVTYTYPIQSTKLTSADARASKITIECCGCISLEIFQILKCDKKPRDPMLLKKSFPVRDFTVCSRNDELEMDVSLWRPIRIYSAHTHYHVPENVYLIVQFFPTQYWYGAASIAHFSTNVFVVCETTADGRKFVIMIWITRCVFSENVFIFLAGNVESVLMSF